MPQASRASSTGALLRLLVLLQSAAIFTPSAAGAGAETCAAVDSLGRLVDFFSRNIDHVDADGYFGLSMASLAMRSAPVITMTGIADICGETQAVELDQTLAQLEHLLRAFRSRFPSPAASGTNRYDALTYWEICRPLEVILRRRIRAGTFRWRRLKDGHRHLPNSGTHGSLNSTEIWLMSNFKKLINYNESVGDACFRELFKTRRGRCSISPMCRKFFLHTRRLFGYALTHQFIYWLVSVEKSCQEKLSDDTPVDSFLLDEACGRSYSEYTKILRSGHSSNSGFIDLMIEHAVLCGFYGFRNFFADSTVLLLRRLQNERLGCFADSSSSDAKMESARTVGTEGTSPLMKKGEATGRKLMHDVMLDGICSSHTSGLAAAYFALFLRY